MALLFKPPRQPRTVYLETNVWDQLQRRGGIESMEAAHLKAAVDAAQVRIVAGTMVFEETLPLYQAGDPRGTERLKLIGHLADLDRTIDTGLLRHCVDAAILGEGPVDPYTDRFSDLDDVERVFTVYRSEIAATRVPNLIKDDEALELMKESRAVTQAELKKAPDLLKTLTFPAFMRIGHFRIEHLIGRLYVGEKGLPLPDEIVARVARQRPVQMYYEGLNSMLYDQMILNRRPRSSDTRDLHHAVASSITQGLVSEDGAFRDWCRRVTIPDYEVHSLQELVAAVSGATA